MRGQAIERREEMEPTKNNLAQLLFEFVERVVKKGATPEEVKVLPETARLLAELMEEGWRI